MLIPPPPSLWPDALECLRSRLTPPAFDTWIQTASLQAVQDNYVVIQAANPFVLNHLQKHYIPLLVEIFSDLLGCAVEIQLTTVDRENIAIVNGNEKKPGVNREDILKNPQLNPKYTFSRFVVGPTNRMAHAASLAVAESPGREFNPLFLCGGVGLGKTHLMQAIAHYRLEMFPDAKVFYISTEQFTNDLITAIRQDSMERFREHYRSADFLLIDDIQFIEGKEFTQEEFFYTFNTLHEAGNRWCWPPIALQNVFLLYRIG